MGQQSGPVKEPAEQIVKEIRRATRRQFSAEEKIRIVLSGLRGEDSIAELFRREGIVQNLYYRWSKEFLEAGKKRLAGDTARAATSDEVRDLRREASALKEVVAELVLENRLLKKSTLGAGRTAHEIPRRREAGDHPAGREVPATGASHPGETRHSPGDLLPLVRPAQQWWTGGLERPLAPPGSRVDRIPDGVRENVIQMALDEPALSPRELAVRFTDSQSYFVSEASVYRLLKAHDLIASPAFIVIKAADAFQDKTTAPNQLWQTDFTYLKVIGWGWFCLSTVLDDFSRYIVAWKLCTNMTAEDATARSTWRCRLRGCTRPGLRSGCGSCPTMVPAMSRATWPNGSTSTRSSTFAAHPIIR
jgi:transposase-like protein